MTENDVARLAGENEEAIAERKRCTEKLLILDAGLRDLKRFEKHQSTGEQFYLHTSPSTFL